MRLGIDFGTTRIVAAAADRGNYPVIDFEALDGTTRDWFPPMVAVRGPERRYGFDAWAAQEDPSWTVVRSMKRLLGVSGLNTAVEIGGERLEIVTLLRELAVALRTHLVERSTLTTLSYRPGAPLEVMLGVPANAHSNQRFLTADAFRAAGFDVLGMLNEPSAASIELGHRSRVSGEPQPKRAVLVYDFGGGTFDASIVELDGQSHVVRASEGVHDLGGDDIDEVLADLALEAAGVQGDARETLSPGALFRLYEACRAQKETLHPNSRRLVIDLDAVDPAWSSVTVPVATLYARCEPLIEQTLTVVDRLIQETYGNADGTATTGRPPLDAIYVIGGASELPLVARRLRERFGRRLRRSAYPRSATAIGLAIQAAGDTGYSLRDRFSRYFGVWREADGGTTAVFDPLFPKGTPLPGPGDPPLVAARRYHPAHNLGHFRFLECSQLGPDGRPAGDITLWDEIRFPFDPGLRDRENLAEVDVHHTAVAPAQQVEETCLCEASGTVVVSLVNQTAGYSRKYELGHWGARSEPLKAARPPRKRK